MPRGAGSRALLVMYRGRLAIERYFVTDDATSLLPAALVARPLAAMAVGLALADGRIASLDSPVARYLPEWDDEARGRITIRQLLEETSGLETGGDIRGLLYRSPWGDPADLPAFATSRGVRMLLGNDFESSALGFRLEHEPGGFYNLSPANTQLAAVIVERATGTPFETLCRRTRVARGGCRQRTTAARPARRHARGALLLARDGTRHAARAEPARYRWQIFGARGVARRVGARDGASLTRQCGNGHAGRPTQYRRRRSAGSHRRQWQRVLGHSTPELAILNIANPGGGSLPELPAMLLKGLAGDLAAR